MRLSSDRLSRRGVLAAGLGAAIGAAGLPRQPAAAAGPVVALTHVTLIDATGAPAQPDTTVIVTGQTISAIGRSAEVRVPPHALEVDLRGRFLIPGLCDMHVHSLFPEGILPALYVAAGVTTVREMMGLPWVHQWRERVEAGELLGPRWIVGSAILDGRPSIWSGNTAGVFDEIGTPREAREAVRRARRDGADFVKLYSRIDRRILHAVAAEARRQGLPFAGHAADAVPMTEASAAGQRSFEHLFPAHIGASGNQAAVRRLLGAIRLSGNGTGHREWFHGIQAAEWLAATTYDPHRAAGIYARLAARGTAITPTLVMHRITDLPAEVDADPERLRYLPPGTAQNWAAQLAETFVDGRTAEQARRHRMLFAHRLRVIGEMRRAGVPVLAGTDAGGIAFGYPGFSVHDELALLVQAGFTPMQALQAATREPARFLGRHDASGTVRRGHVADLVVLDANPLDDIRNTLRIHAVLVRGRYISPTERERLLASIAATAQATRTSPATVSCCG
ncbi:amidohydrolase family protein [Actinoplanes sp. G11-F43]|uniref:amidohydrolase family protein n=1 Tax=Actinoplanes sp. G11-F43 TaxID=3424130 RepID=UPI003D3533BC